MVALGVEDLERARAFYEDGLALPRVESPPGVLFFNLNGTWLGLSLLAAQVADIGLDSAASGYAGLNLVHNVGSEAEVDALLDTAVAAGGVMVKAAMRADWGGYHGYFADPDGHIWEVAHNPFVWIGPEDG